MKILVLSDTHGIMGPVFKLINEHDDIDTIIHLGDYYDDAMEILEKKPNKNVIAVKGNCDGNYDEDGLVYNTLGGKILCCHGHGFGIGFGYEKLFFSAQENGCKMALFGHLHKPVYEEYRGVTIFSPGSLTKPRNFDGKGTYGILSIKKGIIEGNIFEYNANKKVFRGEYLKNLMNNSDRF